MKNKKLERIMENTKMGYLVNTTANPTVFLTEAQVKHHATTCLNCDSRLPTESGVCKDCIKRLFS